MSYFNWTLLLLCLLFFASCKKDSTKLEYDPPALTFSNPQIGAAYTFYQQLNVSNRSFSGEDTLDIFQAFNLNWDQARVSVKDSLYQFVIVPIQVPQEESVVGDMIFYTGSCGFSMELWWFPKTNTFTNGQHELLQKGKVCVMNDCFKSAQIFIVENSRTIFADSISIPSITSNTVEDRGPGDGCYKFGKSIWDDIASFWKSLGESIGGFFSGGGGGSNGTSNTGNGGGFTITLWSGLGGWFFPGFGFGGNGNGGGGDAGTGNGTGNNPTYTPSHPGTDGQNGNPNPNTSCLITQLANFQFNFGIDLLTDYEEIAYGCFNYSCNYATNEACAIDALNAIAQPREDGTIDILDPDNDAYTGPRERIPNCIELADGSHVTVNFGTTNDGINADQPIATCLIAALISALQCTHDEGFNIESIYINSTTNGDHEKATNHHYGLAIDLSRINGVKMVLMNAQQLQTVAALQNCLETFDGIRENFGPTFKHKFGQNYNVTDHKNHVHFSINSDTNCNPFNLLDHKCN